VSLGGSRATKPEPSGVARRAGVAARAIAAALLLVVCAAPAPAQESREAQEERWEELNDRARKFHRQGHYTEAITAGQEAMRLAETAFGVADARFAAAVNNLAEIYRMQARYADAEPLFLRALALREKAAGPDDPQVAATLNDLAELYQDEGRFAEAEQSYKRALAIREKRLGPRRLEVAMTLNNLGELYRVEGRFAEAEPLHLRALAIKENALGPDHPRVATTLNNLAALYTDQSKYRQAESLYLRALRIAEVALGPEHPDVASSLNNLAELYKVQGKYLEARPLYTRVLDILVKTVGREHPMVADTLNNIAGLLAALGQQAEAERFYRQALEIEEKALGAEHPGVAMGLANLGSILAERNDFAEADPLLRRSLTIREKIYGPQHYAVANSLNNLAAVYDRQGKYAQAEPLYLRAAAILEQSVGPDHQDTGAALSNLGSLYDAWGRPAQAEEFYGRSLGNFSRRLEQHFAYMSEKERLGFLDTIAPAFPSYFSFCFRNGGQNPALAGKMYDVLLWQKGFVAASVATMRAKIAASGDREALALLDRLTAKKTKLAALAAARPADREQWQRVVTRLEDEANQLERELVGRSASVAEEKKLARVSWRQVRQALRPGEAAVEVVRFHFHDGKKWTDKSYYVALVVTPETTAGPRVVMLGDASKLEGDPIVAYQQQVGLGPAAGRAARGAEPAEPAKPTVAVSASSFYDAFWKPLEAALGGARRVYLSPDGVLNQVSLGVVAAGDGRLLMETYDLRIVSSTKDLLRPPGRPASNAAVLIGNPDFSLDEATYRAALRSFQKTEVAALAAAPSGNLDRSAQLRGGTLAPLPGTQAEVEGVSSLLNKQRWNVEVFTQQNALEESVKRVRRPRVLHVATHGFFESDQQRKQRGTADARPSGLEDPMLRSGLYFAGADRALSGKTVAEDLDDGVLTSYEATQLNLQGTELVVLSACETGLGQTAAGEGVFGLRRALQVAGAEAVLMSMWAVPDRETQELMTLFYQKWLEGKDKHQALREAELEMRERVRKRYGEDRPQLWGAFVLVGR